MSARQRPHTFTVCIPVSQSSVPLHRCFCVCVHDSFIVVMYFYLGVCVAVFFCFFYGFCSAAVMARSLNL